MLDYFFDKNIDVLGRYIQYFSNQKIIGCFINSDEYTLESERLSNTIRQWANNEEKEKFLIALGAKGNLSDEIKRRKAFVNNEPISLPYSNNIITEVCAERAAEMVGKYGCFGFDTYGPFKLVGGLKKGHPDENEIQGAVKFFESLL